MIVSLPSNMTGSLQIRRNKYFAVLNFKDENGGRKPQWIPLHIEAVKGNKKKVSAAFAQVLVEYEGHEVISAPQSAPLFTVYIKEWLELKKDRIERSTWDSYECYIRRHILPYFEPLGLTIDPGAYFTY